MVLFQHVLRYRPATTTSVRCGTLGQKHLQQQLHQRHFHTGNWRPINVFEFQRPQHQQQQQQQKCGKFHLSHIHRHHLYQQQQRCWYRGESGDGIPELSLKEMELLSIAQPKSEEIRKRHERLVELKDIPKESLGDLFKTNTTNHETKEQMELQVRKKRLIYRSKQRGWLEVDVLLGTWAAENVPHLDEEELDEFEEFVNFETIDIYNIITSRLDVPEDIKQTRSKRVVQRIQEWAMSSPLGKADPGKYKRVKTENNLI